MKTIRISVIVVLIIVILPLLGYGVWLLRKGTSLDIIFVNKSLINYQGSENEAMNYVLAANKILTTGNRPYNMRIDYQGFVYDGGDYRTKFPRLKDIDRAVEKADLLYYADVEGVMKSDLQKLKDGMEDRLEYGGLNNTDYLLLKTAIESNKALIIEFSFFCSPSDPLVRYNIEQLTDTYWVGWIGKKIDRLENSSAQDRIDWQAYYADIHGREFEGSGKGIVFLNKDIQHIVVLEEGLHYTGKKGFIYTAEDYTKEFNLPASTAYSGWFSIIHPGRNAVLSNFEIAPTEEGQEVLNEEGIPSAFPAMIQLSENSYLMAGDFAHSKVESLFPRVEGFRQVFRIIKGSSSNASNFFYCYFQPFMSGIVKELKIEAAQSE